MSVIRTRSEISTEFRNKIIKSKIYSKKGKYLVLLKIKFLLSIIYIKRGNHLSINFCKNVKRINPSIVEKRGFEIKFISLSVNFED